MVRTYKIGFTGIATTGIHVFLPLQKVNQFQHLKFQVNGTVVTRLQVVMLSHNVTALLVTMTKVLRCVINNVQTRR